MTTFINRSDTYKKWEKVRTTKIRTSKTKKNIKNASTHQNIEGLD
jgi:hypothetical protein